MTEWLHKLPDKSSDSWTLPTHSQSVSISGNVTIIVKLTCIYIYSVSVILSDLCFEVSHLGTKTLGNVYFEVVETS